MNSRKRLRIAGTSVFEFMIAGFITTIVGAGFVATFVVYYNWWDETSNTNAGNAYARYAVDTAADRLRNASQYATASNAVIAAGDATSVTFYTDSAGATTTLWLDTSTTPAKLKKTDNAATGMATVPILGTLVSSGTTVTLLPGVNSLTFTYYMPPAGNYTADSTLWTTTAVPSAPAAAELPQLGAVKIDIQTTNNGYVRSLSTFVRLRGSPKKTAL